MIVCLAKSQVLLGAGDLDFKSPIFATDGNNPVFVDSIGLADSDEVGW